MRRFVAPSLLGDTTDQDRIGPVLARFFHADAGARVTECTLTILQGHGCENVQAGWFHAPSWEPGGTIEVLPETRSG